METICEKIRLENAKAEATMQTALEEDINLAENKEDVDKILLQKGKVKVDEIKVASSHAFVKGKMIYSILYRTLENATPLQSITGTLAFQEDVYINGLENGDHVIAEGDLEDISVHIINSRKLNLRALLVLHVVSEDMTEEEICIDIEQQDRMNTLKKNFDFVEIMENKRDIFRIRDEVELPKNMPNIAGIIWKDIRAERVSYKPMNGKLFLKGELNVFLLYQSAAFESSKEALPLQSDFTWYETKLPFQGELECAQSRENMLLDMQVKLGNETIDIRQDSDMESRLIGIDCSLDVTIHLYEAKEMGYVADAYSVRQEIQCARKQFTVKNIFHQKTEQIPIEEKFSLNMETEAIDKICYSGCSIHFINDFSDTMEPAEKEEKHGQITISGYLTREVLYQTIDENGNTQFKTNIADCPFSMSADVPQDGRKYHMHANGTLENFAVSFQGKDTVEIQADIQLSVKVYAMEDIMPVSAIEANPLPYEQMKELPGMLIYYVKNGDSLWQIGKKYYMDVDKIKELNHLKEDVIQKGDKLLLMKEL